MTSYNLTGDIKNAQRLSGNIKQSVGLSADISVQFYSSNGSAAYNIGHGLRLDAETNTLSVNTANEVQQDNTLPITSAAVYTTVGNIEALLKTI